MAEMHDRLTFYAMLKQVGFENPELSMAPNLIMKRIAKPGSIA
jgi:hypothetical protein